MVTSINPPACVVDYAGAIISISVIQFFDRLLLFCTWRFCYLISSSKIWLLWLEWFNNCLKARFTFGISVTFVTFGFVTLTFAEVTVSFCAILPHPLWGHQQVPVKAWRFRSWGKNANCFMGKTEHFQSEAVVPGAIHPLLLSFHLVWHSAVFG